MVFAKPENALKRAEGKYTFVKSCFLVSLINLILNRIY